MVIVPQSADPLLEVRLEKGACIPEQAHAHLVLFLEPSTQLQSFLGKNSFFDSLQEIEVKGGLSAYEAGIHQGSQGFGLFTRKVETVLNASYCMSQVEAQIP